MDPLETVRRIHGQSGSARPEASELELATIWQAKRNWLLRDDWDWLG
jgi:hypothetical protein